MLSEIMSDHSIGFLLYDNCLRGFLKDFYEFGVVNSKSSLSPPQRLFVKNSKCGNVRDSINRGKAEKRRKKSAFSYFLAFKYIINITITMYL